MDPWIKYFNKKKNKSKYLQNREKDLRNCIEVHQKCQFKVILDEFHRKQYKRECAICFELKYDFLFSKLSCCPVRYFCTDCITNCIKCPICRKSLV